MACKAQHDALPISVTDWMPSARVWVRQYHKKDDGMKITLISLDQELYCIGIRILSACLRRAGHQVQCLFLPFGNISKNQFRLSYPDSLLEEISSLCADSDLIGLSLLTNQFVQAVSITKYLKQKKISAPIIWGGVHPTVDPDGCLEHADIVCIGEGEEALLELVGHLENNRPYTETRNLWFRSPSGTIRNPLRPLIQNLDALPLPDYSCKEHYIACGDHIETLTTEKLLQYEGPRFRAQNQGGITYPIMTSRGCPFSCTYCCNSVYARLYPHERHLRWFSIDHVIAELQMIRETVASLKMILMVDDNFTARSEEELRAFTERYRAEINVPFACQCSPLTITAEKMEILIAAGCAKIVMGVETANERAADIYNRRRFHRVLPTAIATIEKYRSRMSLPPTYQFIIDNPYETLEETLETLRFAVNLPRPWDNPIFSLMLFPGTPLYTKAKQDGLVQDEVGQIYGRDWLEQSRPFFQFWIRLYRANFPPLLLRILLWTWIARLLTSNPADRAWRSPFLRWLWSKSPR